MTAEEPNNSAPNLLFGPWNSMPPPQNTAGPGTSLSSRSSSQPVQFSTNIIGSVSRSLTDGFSGNNGPGL